MAEHAIINIGLKPTDISKDISKITFYNQGVINCISAPDDDFYFEFYSCNDTADAAEVYS